MFHKNQLFRKIPTTSLMETALRSILIFVSIVSHKMSFLNKRKMAYEKILIPIEIQEETPWPLEQ